MPRRSLLKKTLATATIHRSQARLPLRRHLLSEASARGPKPRPALVPDRRLPARRIYRNFAEARGSCASIMTRGRGNTRVLAVLGGVVHCGILYSGMYVGVRATHQLVRNQDGCVSRPGGGFLDPVPSCKDLERIDRLEGRTKWQVAFRPLVVLEERLRGPAAPAASVAQ